MRSRCATPMQCLPSTRPQQQGVEDSLPQWMGPQGRPRSPRENWQRTAGPTRYAHSSPRAFSCFSSGKILNETVLEEGDGLLATKTWYSWQVGLSATTWSGMWIFWFSRMNSLLKFELTFQNENEKISFVNCSPNFCHYVSFTTLLKFYFIWYFLPFWVRWRGRVIIVIIIDSWQHHHRCCHIEI